MSGDSSDPGTAPAPRRERPIRPLFVDRLPPCNSACPAGENVQAWLAEARTGRHRQAWDILVRDNPLPAVHGRVCYHPCEEHCNRHEIDESVAIHAVERFLGDLALAEGWPLPAPQPSTGRRVLVVGAGPCGLSAAYHLARFGHAVTVYEAGPVAGGMMHFGIPRYRLPRDILDAEIRRIAQMGVTFVLNRKVEDLLAEKNAGGFDAVCVAIGAHISKRQAIPARDAGRLLGALEWLRQVEFDAEPPRIGRRVAVYGGGNTAMDAARTALRLGVEPVIIYRRTREQMPAHDFEATEALTEGVSIHWLRTIKAFDGLTLTVEVMRLDERGFPQPTGTFETLDADAVILALGQETDSRCLQGITGVDIRSDGTILVNAGMMTGHPGIFAGGDMVPGDRTVTTAVGHGKRVARHIDAWLRGETYESSPKHEGVSLAMMHRWYHRTAEPTSQPVLAPSLRQRGFDEVVGGVSEPDARYEAERCLSCGNCYECDGCYAACPKRAVIKLGPGLRYAFDLDRCDGCAICFTQCPSAAITMIPEANVATTTWRKGEAPTHGQSG